MINTIDLTNRAYENWPYIGVSWINSSRDAEILAWLHNQGIEDFYICPMPSQRWIYKLCLKHIEDLNYFKLSYETENKVLIWKNSFEHKSENLFIVAR